MASWTGPGARRGGAARPMGRPARPAPTPPPPPARPSTTTAAEATAADRAAAASTASTSTSSFSPLHAALHLPYTPGAPPTPRPAVRAAWRALARRAHPDVLPQGTPPAAAAAAASAYARARAAAGVLGDSASEAAYRRRGLASLPPSVAALFGGGSDLRDRPSAAASAPVRGRDVGAVLLLSFEEAALGATKPVELMVDLPCAACGPAGSGGGAVAASGLTEETGGEGEDGRGRPSSPSPPSSSSAAAAAHAPRFTPCRACGGGGGALFSRTAAPLVLGRVSGGGGALGRAPADAVNTATAAATASARRGRSGAVRSPGPPGPAAVWGTCPACGGGGDAARAWCSTCGGAGLAPGVRPLSVLVPPGVLPDSTLRVPGGGGAGTGGGEDGDAFLLVAVEPSAHGFWRGGGGEEGEGGEGGGGGGGRTSPPLPGVAAAPPSTPTPIPTTPADVLSTLHLTVGEAVLGVDRLAVCTLRGAGALRVPGGTQHGATLALSGEGIEVGGGGRGGRGRHLFRVAVVLPTLEELGDGGVAAAAGLRELEAKREARRVKRRGGGAGH